MKAAEKRAELARNAVELRRQAETIWYKVVDGRSISDEEKGIMEDAYWAGVLPKSHDYSVSQWVEDDCPAL